MQQISGRTPMPKYDFNELAKQAALSKSHFNMGDLHGCFPAY